MIPKAKDGAKKEKRCERNMGAGKRHLSASTCVRDFVHKRERTWRDVKRSAFVCRLPPLGNGSPAEMEIRPREG